MMQKKDKSFQEIIESINWEEGKEKPLSWPAVLLGKAFQVGVLICLVGIGRADIVDKNWYLPVALILAVCFVPFLFDWNSSLFGPIQLLGAKLLLAAASLATILPIVILSFWVEGTNQGVAPITILWLISLAFCLIVMIYLRFTQKS